MLVKIVYCDSNNNITMPKDEFEKLLNDVEKDAYREGYNHAVDSAQITIPFQKPYGYDTTPRLNEITCATNKQNSSDPQVGIDTDSPMLTNNVDPSEMNDSVKG